LTREDLMTITALARVVYVVDTDESVRQGLARLVDSAGLESTPCDSVEAFLGQTPGKHVACAVLDVSDPRLEDRPLRSRLRAMAAAIPVIALSVRDDAETRRVARELGAQAFFRKPVDAAALLDSIDWVTRAEGHGESG
jgi:FixJ family two-component response regulator